MLPVFLFEVAREQQELFVLTHVLFNSPDKPITDGPQAFRLSHLPSSLPVFGTNFLWKELLTSLCQVSVLVFNISTFLALNL